MVRILTDYVRYNVMWFRKYGMVHSRMDSKYKYIEVRRVRCVQIISSIHSGGEKSLSALGFLASLLGRGPSPGDLLLPSVALGAR